MIQKTIFNCISTHNAAESIVLFLEKNPETLEQQSAAGGSTPLLVAAQLGRINVIEALLDKGANIEAVNEFGETPLLIAVKHDRTDVVELLLTKGANREAVNIMGERPIMQAAFNGNNDIFYMLLEKGVNIEASSVLGDTPLLIAAQHRRFNFVDSLLTARCNKIAANFENKTADDYSKLFYKKYSQISFDEDIIEIRKEVAVNYLLKNYNSFYNIPCADFVSSCANGIIKNITGHSALKYEKLTKEFYKLHNECKNLKDNGVIDHLQKEITDSNGQTLTIEDAEHLLNALGILENFYGDPSHKDHAYHGPEIVSTLAITPPRLDDTYTNMLQMSLARGVPIMREALAVRLATEGHSPGAIAEAFHPFADPELNIHLDTIREDIVQRVGALAITLANNRPQQHR